MSELKVDTELPPDAAAQLKEDNSADLNKPEPTHELNNLFKEMHVDELYRTDSGPSATIDVIPDFRYITIQLVEHSIKIYQQIAQLSVPTVTPASLLAYFLDCIYTYGTVNDAWMIRECTSYYGNKLLDDHQAMQSLFLACHSAVPPFLRDIIRQLEFTFDPRRPNLAYIYSFAAYSFPHDSGRIYPIHMFLALHNIIAEAGPDDTEATLWTRWLSYVVIRTATETITVGHLIGGAYDDNLFENFVTKSFHKLLSPIASTGSKARPVLEPFDFIITEQPAFDLINPYIYLLGNEKLQLNTFMNFRNLLRSQVYELFPDCIPIWQLYGLESGSTIMNHCYTSTSVPTFHALPIKLTSCSQTTTMFNFKEKLKFKCTYACKEAPLEQYTMPAANTYTQDLYLVGPDDLVPPDALLSSSLDPDDEQWIIYSPWSPGKASTYYPLTSGLIIETNELDGTHVPMPALENSIHDENSHFLESAVPLKAVVTRNDYDGTKPHMIRKRKPEARHETKVSFSKYDMTVHQIPEYTSVVSDLVNPLPGFTIHTGLTDPKKATTKISFNGNAKDSKHPPHDEFPYKLYTWSSYRWISKQHSSVAQFIDFTYMLTNFRTIYGTFPQTMTSEPLPRLIEED